MTNVPRLSADTPFLQGIPNSMVSKEWYRVLFAMWQAIGAGGGAVTVPDLQTQDMFETPVGAQTAELNANVQTLLYQLAALSDNTAAVSQLRDLISELQMRIAMEIPPSSAGSLGTGNFVDAEVPAGVIDGANAVFTLANTPVIGSVHLYLNGLRQRPTTDYAVAAGTITYTAGAKPQSGDNHLADYRK